MLKLSTPSNTVDLIKFWLSCLGLLFFIFAPKDISKLSGFPIDAFNIPDGWYRVLCIKLDVKKISDQASKF